MNGRLSVVPERKVAIFESGSIDSPNAVIFVGTVLILITGEIEIIVNADKTQISLLAIFLRWTDRWSWERCVPPLALRGAREARVGTCEPSALELLYAVWLQES